MAASVWRHCDVINVLLIRQSGSYAYICVRVSKQKTNNMDAGLSSSLAEIIPM